jgi:hypothetical protein
MRASHGGSSGNPNHVEQREIGLKIRDRNDLLARAGGYRAKRFTIP